MVESGWLVAVGVLLEVGLQLALAGLILLRGRGTPQVRLTWLVVALTIPIAGLVLYLLIGEVRFGRRRLARHAQIRAQIDRHQEGRQAVPSDERLRLGRADRVARLGQAVAGAPPRPGNLLRLYSETDHAIDALVEDLRRAESSANLLFYIWLEDGNGTRVGQALIEAARRGVTCRVLVDSYGSGPFLASSLRGRLEAAGVRVVDALPAGGLRAGLRRLDLRNHRKIAVIDGTVGWTGSQNIADAAFAIKAKFAPWHDLMVRIEGPAVHDLQTLFTQDWLMDCREPVDRLLTPPPPPLAEGVPVQVVGTGPLGSNEGLRALTQLGLLQADQEIVLTTPYFVPDDITLATLSTAALSGVSATLVVPARNDSPLVAAASRSFYEPLLGAGLAIYEYRSGLLHAKTLTVDGKTSVVATANMDRRSYELNFEVSLVVYDSRFTGELRAVQRSYIADSDRVSEAAWSQRGWQRRLLENAGGILAPLL